MIVTISGQAGSGKTTVGKLLAKKLKYKFYDIGTLRKQMAKDRGMTIEEYNVYGETHPETDKDADANIIRLAKTEDNFVMQGRIAYDFIPKSLKIYLKVSPTVAAQRVMDDNSNPERNSKSKSSSLEEIKKLCFIRDKSDIIRYRKIYGISNFTSPEHYDLVIDTSKIRADEVVKKILDYAKSRKLLN